MLLFVGQFQHSLDVKSRLILPAKFRSEFEHGGFLSPDQEGCISLWTPGEFLRYSQTYLEKLHAGGADGRREARFWSASSAEVEIDRQGRFVVPQKIREWGGLDGDVLVVGSLDHLELWSPSLFDEKVEVAGDAFKRGND